MLRIGLTQRVEMDGERNERRDCLDQAWTPLLNASGLLPVPLPNREADPQILLRELKLDGVILTGGNDLAKFSQSPDAAPERDLFEQKLLSVCSETDLPVLGVCRGLQMLVVHHGGAIRPVPGHVATPHPLTLHLPKLMPLKQGMIVNSFHQFGILEQDLGPDWLRVATAPDGSVEAAAHRTLKQWGILWHPERPPSGEEAGLLLRARFASKTG